MKPKEIYEAWAPAEGKWTPWVKPVLFAAMVREEPERLERISAERAPASDDAAGAIDFLLEDREPTYRSQARDTAIVIDLPGARGVDTGAALVERGFRPIPLYNALPSPVAVVDVWPIIAALVRHAEHVAAAPPAALPAFLLDSRREGRDLPVRAGLFDNRAVCRSSDFPSAERLRQAGIRRVLLVMDAIRDDFAPIALEWQTAGLELWWKSAPLTLRAPWLGARLWKSLFRFPGTPGADGAYGAMIEHSSTG